MKISWKGEALSLAMLAGMFVLAAATWSWAPDRIPVHWTFVGEADRFGGKWEGLLGLPVEALVLYVALLLLPRIDPRRANYDAFSGPYTIIRTAIVGVMLSLDVFIHLKIRGWSVGTRLAMPVVAGTMIMIFGNYLPKLKSNWFIGIRTPWTLSSEESWRKTHRLGGRLFVICGAVIVITSVLAPAQGRVVLFGAMMPAILATVVYSYFVWRSDSQRIARGEKES
jgi:immunity protein, SdpI family